MHKYSCSERKRFGSVKEVPCAFVRVTDFEASSDGEDVKKKERVLLRLTSLGTNVKKKERVLLRLTSLGTHVRTRYVGKFLER